jgi:protein phosphatase
VNVEKMPFRISALTHVGAVRTSNEDALAIEGRLIAHTEFGPTRYDSEGGRCVLMLADGMGGHAQGALASKIALSSLIASSRNASGETDWFDALDRANDAVYDLMEQLPSARGMGTTVAGTVSNGASLLHFNVGDSRTYLYSSGCLLQLSHDDVPLSSRRSGPHRQSHQITQSLGGLSRRTGIRPHIGTIQLPAVGDVVLLCSDGLTDIVEDAAIAAAIGSTFDLDQCVSALLRMAMAGGGNDNISIILARRSDE